jgi:predicted nicotinamide N-methyase
MGVVATSDPRKELGNAVALFDHGRPLPAERMIVDAIAQCEKTDDGACIREAYAQSR